MMVKVDCKYNNNNNNNKDFSSSQRRYDSPGLNLTKLQLGLITSLPASNEF